MLGHVTAHTYIKYISERKNICNIKCIFFINLTFMDENLATSPKQLSKENMSKVQKFDTPC